MIHKNYHKYYKFIEEYIPEKVQVIGTNEVVNTWSRKPNQTEEEYEEMQRRGR